METRDSPTREKEKQGQPLSSVPEVGLPPSFPNQGTISPVADGSANATLAQRRDPLTTGVLGWNRMSWAQL